jgi:hypothetical protein
LRYQPDTSFDAAMERERRHVEKLEEAPYNAYRYVKKRRKVIRQWLCVGLLVFIFVSAFLWLLDGFLDLGRRLGMW